MNRGVQFHPSLFSLCGLADLRGFRHLDQPAVLDVIDITVDWHRGRDKGMRSDPPDVACDAFGLILDRTSRRSPPPPIRDRDRRRASHPCRAPPYQGFA